MPCQIVEADHGPRTDADIPEYPVWSHSASPGRESWMTRLGKDRVEVSVSDPANDPWGPDGSPYVEMLAISPLGNWLKWDVDHPVVPESGWPTLDAARAEAARLREDVKKLLTARAHAARAHLV